jgi:hypothetical protein
MFASEIKFLELGMTKGGYHFGIFHKERTFMVYTYHHMVYTLVTGYISSVGSERGSTEGLPQQKLYQYYFLFHV